MILTFKHCITEKRNFGKEVVTQIMDVRVTYNPEDDTIDSPEVFIYQEGKVLEVSTLLHKAEGNPLATMLEEINWREMYRAKTMPDLGKQFDEFKTAI